MSLSRVVFYKAHKGSQSDKILVGYFSIRWIDFVEYRKNERGIWMRYGYARISTDRQDITRQIKNIEKVGVDKIYQEVYTGTTTERPKWISLMKNVQQGDVIVFDSVSRMSRNAEEGYEDYMKLFDMGVSLEFIKQPYINTEVYRNKIGTTLPKTDTSADLILMGVEQYIRELAREQIKLAFGQSEFEVQALRQRTKEGLREAKVKGKQIGRPKGSKRESEKSKRTKKAITAMSKDFKGDKTDKEIAEIVGISLNSYYKYKKELKEDNGKRKSKRKRKCD